MISSATTSCVQVTEAEDAFAISHDEEESGTTGTVIVIGMEKSP
jgi:hypothetical protein